MNQNEILYRIFVNNTRIYRFFFNKTGFTGFLIVRENTKLILFGCICFPQNATNVIVEEKQRNCCRSLIIIIVVEGFSNTNFATCNCWGKNCELCLLSLFGHLIYSLEVVVTLLLSHRLINKIVVATYCCNVAKKHEKRLI